MRLHLVRHGETHANVAQQLDTAVPGLELTEAGQLQARNLVDRLADVELDGLYISDLTRTRQTVTPLARARGIDPVVLGGLREIQAGDYEMSTVWQPYVATISGWRDDPNLRIPGGESGIEFITRYSAAIRAMAEDGNESVLAVSHGAAMRVWSGVALGLGEEFMASRLVTNTIVLTLEGDPDDGWHLLSWGDEPVDSRQFRTSGP